MSTDIYELSEAARQGNWSPLLREAEKVPSKHWAEDANCAAEDTDTFLPFGDGPREDPEEVKEQLGSELVRPLNLCNSCPLPIAARCLVDSIRHDDEWGIRAGLLASERSALRATWKDRVDEKAVQGALRGATAPLTKNERKAVIERFVADPALDPAAVARGLGITHEYLLKLAWRERQRSKQRASLSADQEANAA
ncbi:WhiB family transcriptional regulator [Streptomyces sp. NPDC008086]|uniref:WhiB family transcriptional regulator n=1 Tax=Streptomyces sp. NPDC008086 TaxID=3364807 RepID=UPI0036E9D0C8